MTANDYIYSFAMILQIEAFNPWWSKEPDGTLQKWQEAPFEWFPEENTQRLIGTLLA